MYPLWRYRTAYKGVSEFIAGCFWKLPLQPYLFILQRNFWKVPVTGADVAYITKLGTVERWRFRPLLLVSWNTSLFLHARTVYTSTRSTLVISILISITLKCDEVNNCCILQIYVYSFRDILFTLGISDLSVFGEAILILPNRNLTYEMVTVRWESLSSFIFVLRSTDSIEIITYDYH